MRSCFGAIAIGVLLLAAVAVGWFARDEIREVVAGLSRGDSTTVTAAEPAGASLSAGVEDKIIALGQGEAQEVALGADELNSWIEHGLRGYFPEYVSDVEAAVESEQFVLSGLVAVKQVPGIERLGPLATLFGDTAAVKLSGRLDGVEPGVGVYYVEDVQIGMVPLTAKMRDELLAQLRTGPRGGLPANAVAFQLPRFVADVAVRGDQVVLRGVTQEGR